MSEEDNSENNSLPNSTSGSSKSTLIIMIICVIACAVGLALFLKKEKADQVIEKPKNGAVGKGNLVDGKEYMIYIRKIEVAPMKSDGKAWDVRGSAPDIYYQLTWRGNRIHESDTKKDALIANWIPIGIDLKDTILQGGVTVDQAVKLPIIKRDSKDESTNELIFKVIDDDIAGDDEIETMRVYIDRLNIGDNEFDYTGKEGHGVLKAIIRVIDNSLSTNEKIELLMGGG